MRDDLETKDVPAPAAPHRPAGGEHVLLIDDEPFMRGALARYLELEGYRVRDAASAVEARAILGSASGPPIQAIILDQAMPGESGLAALPSLRALSDAPIILFSGYVPERPPGVAAVFEKSARPAELLALLRKVLDAK